ncbi:hypothetical protein SLS53_007328 [Cytospora paraplurivora]|uniref:Putative phospholipase n=1 Tax=Cytospora paraplurivora TaxID=2898453 RepID=A0AAN9U334_9PEZI
MRPASGSRASSTLVSIRHRFIPLIRGWVGRGLPPLLSLLRPRLTIRYVIFTIVTLWISYRILISQPLLASKLPGHTGPYEVGALEIEVPLETPRRVSDIRFRADGKYAFEVETVLFTLYYPAQHGAAGKRTGEKYYWFPKPISATARGYARAMGMDNFLVRGILTGGLWLVAGGIQIPAMVGAPLLSADAMGDYGDQVGDGRLPVMIFTHGMMSSRTDYTSYIGELASRGVVVAAVEHRDGSSPASPILRDPNGTPDWRYYFGLKHLDPYSHQASGPSEGEGEKLDSPALKEAQLSFREAEIEAAVDVLRVLDSGTTPLNNVRQRPGHADTGVFGARLNTQNITIAGHSYGGTGALRALRSGPSPSRPFTGAVVLDPGKSSGPLNTDVRVPVVVCHSSSWSRPGPSLFFGRPHFEVVRELVDGINGICAGREEAGSDGDGNQECREKGWFLTSLGTSHPSITDAPVLEPLLLSWTTGSTMDARQGIRQYVLLTRDFVRYQHTGELAGLLSLSGPKADDVVSREYDPKHNEGMPEQWRQYWQIHAAPS